MIVDVRLLRVIDSLTYCLKIFYRGSRRGGNALEKESWDEEGREGECKGECKGRDSRGSEGTGSDRRVITNEEGK